MFTRAIMASRALCTTAATLSSPGVRLICPSSDSSTKVLKQPCTSARIPTLTRQVEQETMLARCASQFILNAACLLQLLLYEYLMITFVSAW